MIHSNQYPYPLSQQHPYAGDQDPLEHKQQMKDELESTSNQAKKTDEADKRY